MKAQSYPVISWKLSLVMGLITLSVLGGGLAVRKWFQATPTRSPARMRSLPRPTDDRPPHVMDDANPPAHMPQVEDSSPPRKSIPSK